MKSIPSNRISVLALALSSLALVIAAGPWLLDRISAIQSRLVDRPIEPSLVQLIANPEQFDGALVSIIGHCVMRFEHYAIQPSAGAASWFPGIWLDLDQGQKKTFGTLDAQLCRVAGIFRAGPGGHMARWSAMLEPVHTIVVYDEKQRRKGY